jgi:heme iron utilization protein
MTETCNEVQLREDLKKLFRSQRFAVLATVERSHPYLNMVAFAETEDLAAVLFATTRATRKYANILSESGVALLVDNRSNQEADIRQAIAVTIVGAAEEVPESHRAHLRGLYLGKHPHMKGFLDAADTALIKIDVETYYMVSRFQNVTMLRLK